MLGHELEEWSTFGKGINSSFRMLMGEMRFDEMLKKNLANKYFGYSRGARENFGI